MVFATVPAGDYLIASGADLIGRFRSSEKAERWFCGRCGTPLLFRELVGSNYEVSVATLDEPEKVLPGFHIFYDSRIAWAEAADTLPRFARSRHE